MTYKTILVHLNDSRHAEAVLAPAVELAGRFDAHLTGLHVCATVPSSPIPMASSLLNSIVSTQHKNTEAIVEIFKRVTTGKSDAAEWQMQKVPYVDLANVVMGRGRVADLIVTGQTDPEWDLSPFPDFPERLALESGRPVLVIPYAGRYSAIGRRIAIAWKATRESARAVFDALPLLRKADAVHILEVKESADAHRADASIAVALARHGIKPEVQTSVASDISVGDEVLSRAADFGADLLVMGAYGHLRFREQIFGGATNHIARHMTLPTLFSH